MLEIQNLKVSIGRHTIVDIERLALPAGSRLGMVGESGSGKTMTAMTIVGLQPGEAVVTGSILFEGRELVGLTDTQFGDVRGRHIGVIFQDPAKALNPMMRVGKQVAEAIRLHLDLNREGVNARVLDLLTQVQLPDAEELLRRYPHQLSGGQQQRVLIAIAIACDPKLLIADEPTTALDVTVQHGILELLRELSASRDMGLLFVSHDLGVIETISETVGVVYGGHLVEFGPVAEVIGHARHRYTQALVAANPGIADDEHLSVVVNQRLDVIRGSVPALGKFPSGCRFRGRCTAEIDACVQTPEISTVTEGHIFKCWNPIEGFVETQGAADVTR